MTTVLNRNFGDIENVNRIVYAPETVTVDGRVYQTPTAELYARAVPPWWPVSEVHPAPQTGYHEEETDPTKIPIEKHRTIIVPVPLTPEEEAENQRRIDKYEADWKEWDEGGRQGDEPQFPELIYHDPIEQDETYYVYEIHRNWVMVADPVPVVVPRKWTRLKMKTALAAAGYLQQVKAMLGNIEIAPGYTALEAFTDCDYIEEFWPDASKWGQMLDLAAATLGKTRAEIDAFLDSVPTDPGATI